MSNEETSYMICAPTDDPRAMVVPGTITISCAMCEKSIYVAPSGQEIILEKNVVPICITCGLAQMAKEKEMGEDVKIHPLNKKQRSEVVKHQVAKLFGEMLDNADDGV